MFWKDWYMIDLKLTYTRELTVRDGNWVLTLHNWMLLMRKCWTTGLCTCIVVWSTDVYSGMVDRRTYLYRWLVDILIWSTDVHTYKQTNKQTIKLHLHILALIRKTTHFQNVTTWTRILPKQGLWIVYFTIYNLFTHN